MGLSRRSVLRTGSVALLSASIVKPALAAPAVIGLRDTGARTLSFNCYNTGEQLKATTYWADGKYIPDALSEINYALRDDRSGEVHPIQPKVLDLIHQIGKKLDTNCHFEVYSGYRSPKTNAMLRRANPEVAAHMMRVTETAHWLEWQDWAHPILQTPYRLKGGELQIPDVPGVGIEWNEDAVRRYRYDA